MLLVLKLEYEECDGLKMIIFIQFKRGEVNENKENSFPKPIKRSRKASLIIIVLFFCFRSIKQVKNKHTTYKKTGYPD